MSSTSHDEGAPIWWAPGQSAICCSCHEREEVAA
jgi:hypothetical protein